MTTVNPPRALLGLHEALLFVFFFLPLHLCLVVTHSSKRDCFYCAREQQECDKGSPKNPPKGSTSWQFHNMKESCETYEEDVVPQGTDSPPQRPSRPLRRPELYATRKLKEEMASVPLQIKAEPKILTRELTFSRSTSMSKPVPTLSTTKQEVPWESVTLNRCLFVAITILVLTSGIQRLHEVLHSHRVSSDEEQDEYGLIMRRSGVRHRAEPETTLWELMFSWLPDLNDDDDDDEDDDEDDEDEDEEDGDVRVRKRKPNRRRLVKTLRGLRNRPLLDKRLLKQRDEKSKGRQAKKSVLKTDDFGEPDVSTDAK